jgi:hypothetical protein
VAAGALFGGGKCADKPPTKEKSPGGSRGLVARVVSVACADYRITSENAVTQKQHPTATWAVPDVFSANADKMSQFESSSVLIRRNMSSITGSGTAQAPVAEDPIALPPERMGG